MLHGKFERHIYESVKQSVTTIEAHVVDRIYALSFFIYDDEDDPRRPTLTATREGGLNFGLRVLFL